MPKKANDSEAIIITSEYKGTIVTSTYYLSVKPFSVNESEHQQVLSRHVQLHQRCVEAVRSDLSID